VSGLHSAPTTRAIKLIISKITKSSYQSKINAYKKYTTKGFQLSLTGTMTQFKARKTTNTPRDTLDLELCNYKET
jgi:hypothetical protein